MSSVSTHILDLARGLPATGVTVVLEVEAAGTWTLLGTQQTDADGRCQALVPPETRLVPSIYRLRFETQAYFRSLGDRALYPVVFVTFEVTGADSHYHLPLLLTANGYTTYRGT